MRGRLEALMEDLLDTAKVSRCPDYADGIRHAVDCLRALLATEPVRVRMEPQPPVKAKFVRLRGEPTGWVWALITRRNACSGPLYAPSPAHIPVEIDGVWWWEVPHDPR